MKKIILLFVIGAIGYFTYLQLSPQDEKWLHGIWQYAGEELDYMTFYSDGRVDMSNDKRTYARCVYASVVSDKVSVECKVKGETRELNFDVSNNKTLTNQVGPSIYHKK